jgi:hypothetical protein
MKLNEAPRRRGANDFAANDFAAQIFDKQVSGAVSRDCAKD